MTGWTQEAVDARKKLLVQNVVLTVVVAVLCVFVEYIQHPRERADLPISGFDNVDRTFIDEAKISTTGLLLLTIGGLAVTIGAGVGLLGGKDHDDLVWAGFSAVQSFGVALIVTDVIKNTTGAYRPDFLQRCLPDNSDSCTGDEEEVLDGRKSFPSGHSSVSMAVFHWASLYLAAKLRVDLHRGQFWRVLVSWAPTLLALVVGWQRWPDYRHNPMDIFVGQFLGWFVARLTYLHFYPESPLYSPCAVPVGSDPSISLVTTHLRALSGVVSKAAPAAPASRGSTSQRGSARSKPTSSVASGNTEV